MTVMHNLAEAPVGCHDRVLSATIPEPYLLQLPSVTPGPDS